MATNDYHQLYSKADPLLQNDVTEAEFGEILNQLKEQAKISNQQAAAPYEARSWIFTRTLGETRGVANHTFPFSLTFTRHDGEWRFAGFRSP
ncbi:MAG TPA: hypothetical protein VD999_06540 [Vitreimonas sp.]|nr:hypothetical protein [Vitreimonas sp.]